ncbi:MAG TPA: metal-dependent hydrolase [Methanomicrobia archaeon]|nr:metal-dependent hydrolase [Methanomicrobia archaeon]
MMKIEFLGHSAFRIAAQKTVLIDPFLSNNPRSSVKPGDLNDIDMVLVTHGHGDHLGDAIEIAKNNDAVFVAMYELAHYAASKGVNQFEPMNIGGTIDVGGIKITMTNATHSSDFEGGAGHSAGFVVNFGDHSIYHAGDTGVFYDMKLISELYNPEVALLPIGSRFTMGVKEAIKAVELLDPQVVIPMHYSTYPAIEQDPHELKRAVGDSVHVVILAPGESFTF